VAYSFGKASIGSIIDAGSKQSFLIRALFLFLAIRLALFSLATDAGTSGQKWSPDETQKHGRDGNTSQAGDRSRGESRATAVEPVHSGGYAARY